MEESRQKQCLFAITAETSWRGKMDELEKLIDEVEGGEDLPEKEGYTITTPEEAEKAIHRIKRAQVDEKRMSMLCDTRIRQYEQRQKKQQDETRWATEYYTQKLREYFDTVEAKPNKEGTTKTFKLATANLVWSKGKQGISKESEDELLPYVMSTNPDYVKSVESVIWGEYKKTLEICGDIIVDENGEPVPGVMVKQGEDKFEVKFVGGMA